MKSYKDFMFQEEYLDEGKAKAARAATKGATKGGKKLLDKVKGKVKPPRRGGGIPTAAVAGGVAAGAGAVTSGALNLLGGAAKEVGKRAKRIWDGGVNDVDSDGAPGDHKGFNKVN